MTNKLRQIAESEPERCPHYDCGDNGYYHGMSEYGPEPVQCEFCYTNTNSLFNREKRLTTALKLACDVIDEMSEALEDHHKTWAMDGEQIFCMAECTALCQALENAKKKLENLNDGEMG